MTDIAVPEATSAEAALPSTAVAPEVTALQAAVAALTERVTALEARLAGSAVAAAPVAAVAASAVAATASTDGITEIKGLLESLFVVALNTEITNHEVFDAQFEVFKTLVHHDRQGSPLLDTDLRRYKFAPFVGRARDYLTDAARPGSFQLERVLPDVIEPRTESVKVHVFVRNGRRMSPPISFRRDSHCGGAFRIENSSL